MLEATTQSSFTLPPDLGGLIKTRDATDDGSQAYQQLYRHFGFQGKRPNNDELIEQFKQMNLVMRCLSQEDGRILAETYEGCELLSWQTIPDAEQIKSVVCELERCLHILTQLELQLDSKIQDNKTLVGKEANSEPLEQISAIVSRSERTAEDWKARKNNSGKKKPGKRSSDPGILSAAIEAWHGFGSENERLDYVSVDGLLSHSLRKMGWEKSRVSKAFKLLCGGMKNYKKACTSGTLEGFFEQLQDGDSRVEAAQFKPLHPTEAEERLAINS